MPTATHVENPDVILIGSGVMSANLGAMLKRLDPRLSIQLYEASDGLAQGVRMAGITLALGMRGSAS